MKHSDWSSLIGDQKSKPYWSTLMANLNQEYQSQHTIYPPKMQWFAALEYVSVDDVKVIILGQDPYHGPNQAHGLSFSVPHGVAIAPSLKNIFKELHDDIGCPIPSHGCLTSWAKQGVLLLNTTLTVRARCPGSHASFGWQQLTDTIIKRLSNHRNHLVFILWGSHAMKKQPLIDAQKHCILTCAHPSPLSAHRGFFGSKPFSKCNTFLVKHGIKSINWHIE